MNSIKSIESDLNDLLGFNKIQSISMTILLVTSLSFPVYADYSADFIRVTCIPEAEYFEIEYKRVYGPAVYLGIGAGDVQETQQRLEIWRKHNYFNPSNLTYECQLSESKYMIQSFQPPARAKGMCGGDPSITLSLSRNGENWIKKVLFGRDCLGNPSIYQISISDGKRGWGSRSMDIRIHGNKLGPDVCKYYSDSYPDFNEVKSIEQKWVEDTVTKAKIISKSNPGFMHGCY